ncbi:PREDICTED: acidic leucine-rich nuclear phosphoprotein 32 family member B-like [Nicotiana attenuata]|uniref:acidic leucine-rich nuclear phosphoprotein 32 family member B-like n=1 Tax=Nicotiana attenuata TaxID=49451 RepID=UPI000904D40E|nr:PREDICTED: acidic leucine-rich nuclear phosphoprotein 32 family member B-like [Nicotiana attenuata]
MRKSISKKYIPLTKPSQSSQPSKPSNRKGNAEKEASPNTYKASPSKGNAEISKRDRRKKNKEPSKSIENDSDDEALGVKDDENGDDAAQEVDKDAEEDVAEEEEDDDKDDEQLEDGEGGMESETHTPVEGDHDALSIPVFEFAMMTVLNCGGKPSKEAMKKVMDDDQAFRNKVCQSSRKGWMQSCF